MTSGCSLVVEGILGDLGVSMLCSESVEELVR